MLAKCVLANPPRGGRSHLRDTLKLVQSRIQRWKEGDLLGLWSEASAGLRARSTRSKAKTASAESLRRSNATRARRAVEEGQYKKALQAFTSMGLAQLSSEVYNEMLAKHPQSDPLPPPATAPPPPVHVSPEEVARGLRSFPTGSAPGPSGLRANHLKEAVFCSSPHRAYLTLQCLTGVVNHLCAGKAPQAVIPYLCGASLLPCKKKDRGLRPIAVGEVLRRLTSKCAARAVLPDAPVPIASRCWAPWGLRRHSTLSYERPRRHEHPLRPQVNSASRLLMLNRSCHHVPRSEIPSALHHILDGMLIRLPA